MKMLARHERVGLDSQVAPTRSMAIPVGYLPMTEKAAQRSVAIVAGQIALTDALGPIPWRAT